MAAVETERLVLRELEDADCSEWYVGALNDPGVNRFLETRHTRQTLDSVKAFVAAVNARPDEWLFGIFLKSSGQHIGNIKVGPVSPVHRSGDVSLWIGNREHWGGGYATEAITGISRHAFRELGVEKLGAGMYADNEGSYRAFVKAGYKHEGRRHRHYVLDGRRVDLLLVGATKSDLSFSPG